MTLVHYVIDSNVYNSLFLLINFTDFSVLKCSIGLLIGAIVFAVIVIALGVVLALRVSEAAASVIVGLFASIVTIIVAVIGFIKPEWVKECLRCCRQSCSCCNNDEDDTQELETDSGDVTINNDA